MAFTGLYLDANALIYALESDDEALRDAFTRLFGAILFADICTSELSLAELLVDPCRREDVAVIERYKRLFQIRSNGHWTVASVSTEVLAAAACFRGRQIRFLDRKPSLLDSIHAATALQQGCSHFMTSDSRLHLLDQIRLVPAMEAGISMFLEEVR